MPKLKKYSKSQAKAKAWKAFSLYLRTLWTKKGYVKCYTCDKHLTFKTVQVGHWYPGHNDVTYVNEDYVRPQCRQDNYFKGGNYSEFQIRLIKEIGLKAYEELYKQAKSGDTLTINDYLELANWYKKQLFDILNR